jgi:hypothetical protein
MQDNTAITIMGHLQQIRDQSRRSADALTTIAEIMAKMLELQEVKKG